MWFPGLENMNGFFVISAILGLGFYYVGLDFVGDFGDLRMMLVVFSMISLLWA